MARVAQLIGFDVARGTWATGQATIGPGDTHRIFYSGALPASFDGDGTPANITCIVSYKTVNTNVAAYVNSIPAARPVILIYHHEPEGDYTLGATFVAEFKSQADLIHAQGRSNVRVGMCSAGYPYRTGGSADVLAGNYLRGLGNGFADLFTRDVYQGSAGIGGFDFPSNGLANYGQFQNWLGLVTNTAVVGTERPLGITEYGVDDQVGNAARNTRIALDGAYLAAAFTPGGASAVSSFPLQMWCYWWQTITGDPNPAKFTDATTIATWQGFETASTGGGGGSPYVIGSATAATGSAAALTVPVTSAMTAGDVITVVTCGSSSSISTVTDSNSNVYTQRNHDVGAVGAALEQWTADGGNNTGGPAPLNASDVITVTWASTAPSKSAVAVGCSGIATTTPLDQAVNADSAGSTAPSVTSAALAVIGEIAIAAVGNGSGGGAPVFAGGWTQISSRQNPSSGPWVGVAWQSEAGTGAVTASATITSAKWTAELLTFKPVGTVTVPANLNSEIDLALNMTAVIGVPGAQPGGSSASPVQGFPQIYAEAAFITAAPVVIPGTFILDDPVNGKLDTGRLGDANTWTDVTAFVRQGTITRASTRVQGPLTTYQGGTAQVTLDNSDGRFDFNNTTTGPYVVGGVSQVGAMIPVRARASYGNVEYQLFYGFADAWQDAELTYDAGYDEVALSASDGFKVLAGINLGTLPSPAGASETTGARVIRILNSAAWFTDHRVIATGDSTVQGTTYGTDALSLLQLTADSEVGELYVDGGGSVVFRNRHATLTETRSTVPQAVFGDLPGTSHTAGTELAYQSVGPANDDTQLANWVQATRVNGTEQDAKNNVSIRKNLFPRTYSRTDLILEDDITALAWAQWVLTVSLAPEARFDTLTIDPVADPGNLFPQVLGRQIGDRIQIWRRPQNSGQTVTRDCFIRGITHNIDAAAGTWQTVWTLQDAARYGGFLILDDAVLGKLDTAKLAF